MESRRLLVINFVVLLTEGPDFGYRWKPPICLEVDAKLLSSTFSDIDAFSNERVALSSCAIGSRSSR